MGKYAPPTVGGPIVGATTNDLFYASATNILGRLATANSSILVTSAGGVPSLGTALPNGITATTQTVGDNSTKVATTAFVIANGTTPAGSTGNIQFNNGSNTFGGVSSSTVFDESPAVGKHNNAIQTGNHASTTLGKSRTLLLVDDQGNVGDRNEIGLGYISPSSWQPCIVGFRATSSAGNTLGTFYIAQRNATTDTAPSEVFTITSAGAVNSTSSITAQGGLDAGGSGISNCGVLTGVSQIDRGASTITVTSNLTVNNGKVLQVSSAGSYFYAGNQGVPCYLMNSAGSDFGFIQNTAADQWSLSHGTTATSNGNNCLIWDKNQNVAIGNSAIATNATNGFLYPPTCAGAPTGVPASTTLGAGVPFLIDTTNGKLWAYYGGAWHFALMT